VQQFPIVLGAALALVIAAPPAMAQAPPDSEASPRVVVQGQASVTRAPDRAFVTLNTETRAPKPEEAQRANAEAMTAVRHAVAAAGIPADAVRTLGFNLREDVAWNNGKRISQGYVVANSIEVRVDDLEGLGALLDRAVAAGANGAGALRYDLKDRAGAEREALRLAVADARARADAAAAGAGLRVTRVLRIEEQGGPSRPTPVPMMRMAAAAVSEPTPVSAGEIEIASSVTLTAEIGPQ
jgi:uncharacterized protein YggE